MGEISSGFFLSSSRSSVWAGASLQLFTKNAVPSRFDKRNLRWYLLVIKVDSLGWLIGKPPPQIYSLGRAEGEATTNDTPRTKWI